MEFQKACEVTLEYRYDLELVYQDPNPDFFINLFIERGVKIGIAKRFISDIKD
jgi:hypothetical protein